MIDIVEIGNTYTFIVVGDRVCFNQLQRFLLLIVSIQVLLNFDSLFHFLNDDLFLFHVLIYLFLDIILKFHSVSKLFSFFMHHCDNFLIIWHFLAFSSKVFLLELI